MQEKKIYLASNIKHLRQRKNITQKQIASYCDKDGSLISYWENGTREPNAVDLSKLSTLFNVPVDTLLLKDLRFDNAELINALFDTKIPVLGTIKAGIPIEAQQDICGYIDIPSEWLRGGKKYFALKISGDSMETKYQDGDVVVIEQTSDLEKINNKDCVVMVNNSDATFKHITVTDDSIVLNPLNSKYSLKVYTREQVATLPVVVLGVAREKRVKL